MYELIIKDVKNQDYSNLHEVVKRFISYNSIQLDHRILFSSTPYFTLKENDEEFAKISLQFKMIVPDFIVENFSLYNKKEKNFVLDFLKIFISELILLKYLIDIRKKIFIYSSSFNSNNSHNLCLLNRKNLRYFFSQYLKNEVKIIENIPQRKRNTKRFVLGYNSIFSEKKKNVFPLGEYYYSFLNRFLVEVLVESTEIDKFKKILSCFNICSRTFLFSKKDMDNTEKQYRMVFVFKGNKCISIESLCNN